jgi:hypothetical protein
MPKPKAPHLKFETVFVTPTMAEQWLERNHPDNRPVSWSRVEGLANDIREGNWKCTHQGICFNKDGLLVDGQHRLHAIKVAKKGAWLPVFHNDQADFHDPIDRGTQRSVATVTGLHSRETAACTLLYRMEIGNLSSNVPVSVAEVLATMEHHADAMQRIDEVGVDKKSIIAGLRAACAWVMPINASKTADFLQKTVSGEMIKRGDPAYAFRNWLSRNRPRGNEVVLAAINCLRYHIQGKSISSVYTGDVGYRASTAKRRAMRVPNTPGTDLVVGVSWPISDRDDRPEQGQAESGASTS